ncbi:hypothetical protein LJB83_01715 [Clostridia bacterium OttesenSCG-928-F22]|nr:hypothetical protein [Clostridia bacterium OttesenSCG-928-F22]
MQAVLDYKNSVEIPKELRSNRKLHLVQNVFQNYNPLSHLTGTIFTNLKGTHLEWDLSYDESSHNQVVKTIERRIEEQISSLIYEGYTLLEAALACHQYLASNIIYQEGGFSTPYEVLIEGRGVCAGYTAAMFVLLLQAGYDTGYAIEYTPESPEIAGHIWNMIKFGEHWYHVDSTWENGDSSGTALTYFGMTDEERLPVGTPFTMELRPEMAIPECTDDSFTPLRSTSAYILDLHHHHVYLHQYDGSWLLWNTQTMAFTPIDAPPENILQR